jgi:hypothetical protein
VWRSIPVLLALGKLVIELWNEGRCWCYCRWRRGDLKVIN